MTQVYKEAAHGAADAQQAFDSLLATYWPVYFRLHPESATALGVAGHDHRLDPFGDEDEALRHALAQETLAALAEIEPASLDPDRALDWRILAGQQLLALDAFARWDWRVRDPGAFLPIDAIYQLTVRPVPGFPAALRGRLAALPGHLQAAQDFLRRDPARIPPLWLESAHQAALGAQDFLADLPGHPKLADDTAMLRDLLPAAQDALLDFGRFLEDELAPRAQGDFAVGAQRYDLLLRWRHGLDTDHRGLRALGERLFADTEAALKAVTRELRGDDDIAALTASLQADHPAADALLAAYRQGMERVRQFVAARGLVSLPAPEALSVVETPAFLRHQIPFAAYMEPAPNDPRQQGYYYVTPVADPALLAEHNWTGLLHTCAHEAYPGHHLQFVRANMGTASSSFVRLLNPSATLYEGWALYCEQLLVEQGLLARPENRFVLLKDRLWRSLRILIDVGIQTGEMTVDDAATLLVRHLGFPREQALGELAWYSEAPGVPMGYATGWALINALRDRVLADSGDAGALRDFHDRLLAVGSVGLPWAMARAFGEEHARAVQHAVFTL
ncbi:MAG: DUF885 domain-containing protein [Pseudomonadota bacterium]